jgi:hypothetical protein
VEKAKTTIAHGAYLVYGTTFEDLNDVVAGRSKACSLLEQSYEGVLVQMKTNQAEDAGYILLKTQTADKAKYVFIQLLS